MSFHFNGGGLFGGGFGTVYGKPKPQPSSVLVKNDPFVAPAFCPMHAGICATSEMKQLAKTKCKPRRAPPRIRGYSTHVMGALGKYNRHICSMYSQINSSWMLDYFDPCLVQNVRTCPPPPPPPPRRVPPPAPPPPEKPRCKPHVRACFQTEALKQIAIENCHNGVMPRRGDRNCVLETTIHPKSINTYVPCEIKDRPICKPFVPPPPPPPPQATPPPPPRPVPPPRSVPPPLPPSVPETPVEVFEEPPAPLPPLPPKSEEDDDNTFLIAGILGAVVVGGIAYAMTRRKKKRR